MLRLRRKRLLWRAFRKRRELVRVSRKTNAIEPDDILLFAVVRNEAHRLLWFLEHYRRLGVGHFLIVDNQSTDETVAFLANQDDVSVWQSAASYKGARFGMDWLTALLWRYGTGHWTLCVDADELLIYPDWDSRNLNVLTEWLDGRDIPAMGALMLDLYPKGPIEYQSGDVGRNPVELLPWFDAYGYWAQLQPKMQNLWLQGGPRARCFFTQAPERAPTLNKIPLVRWQRAFVYVNSTHNALPRHLNRVYDTKGVQKPTGALLHTKFLPGAAAHARSEKARGEHFANAQAYADYYDAVASNPNLWHDGSYKYEGWQQLERLGLMSSGDWCHRPGG
ncbi:MAG: glycosyltransferase family 2 protein [Pseudomonadota bacterium]